MAFSSQLYPNELIIDESTPEVMYMPREGQSTGLQLGLRSPDGYADLAAPFPTNLIIPRSEWQARIQEMEETKSRLSDLILQAKIPCKNQQKTNYCWIFGPTGCVEVVRMLQNQVYTSLSPASAGAPIKNFSNQGGWGKEGLLYIIAHGLVPSEKWPDTAISRQYWTEDNKRLALKYRVQDWFELRPRNLDQLISCLLRRIPVAVGYNWWGHEVYCCDPVWMDGTAEGRIRNSWGAGWGENGFSVLRGSKLLPDDAVAPVSAMAA